MAQTPLVKPKKGGDFLVDEMSHAYNLMSLPVEATGAANVAQVAGTPVQIDDIANPTKATLVNKVGITNANGFLVHGPAIKDMAAGTTTEKYSVLWAGPGIINANAYNLVEPYGGAAYTTAECNTQAQAMPGNLMVQYEPAQTTEQTPETGTAP